MSHQPRPFAVERRPLPARRSGQQLDSAADLRAVADLLQDVPRPALASMADLLFHLRRCGGRIRAVAARVERDQDELQRLAAARRPRVTADPRAAAERVFAPAKGRVRLPRRAAGQMELRL